MAVESKKGGQSVQRNATGIYDSQENTISNFDFISTNYGLLGEDAALGRGSGIWPRGSQNQYLYGSGFWFAAKKMSPKDTIKKYVDVSYNPNTGKSWMIPGMIQDGDHLLKDNGKQYRLYISTDFDRLTGIPTFLSDGPNWPLWLWIHWGVINSYIPSRLYQ